MNLHEQIAAKIQSATLEVFSTMLGAELGPSEVFVETGAPEPNDGVVSFIGLAGDWAGTGSLTCSSIVACRICSLMLMTESESVDEEVLDAVAELTNMIIGGVKNELEVVLGPLGLSIPTVVFGKNFRTRSAGTAEWTVVQFPWEGERLVVKLCLTPAEKPAVALAATFGQTCALEVQ